MSVEPPESENVIVPRYQVEFNPNHRRNAGGSKAGDHQNRPFGFLIAAKADRTSFEYEYVKTSLLQSVHAKKKYGNTTVEVVKLHGFSTLVNFHHCKE
jgi:hypothetical protein